MNQDLSPYQYFLNLASDDVSKYNELLSFSKQFVSGTLSSPCTQIYGDGDNGKTVFIRLLKLLAESNNIKSCFINPHMLEDKRGISLIAGNNYAIISNDLLSNEFVRSIRKLSFEINTKFIIINNDPLPNDIESNTVSTIHMNAIFTKNNKVIIDPQRIDENKKSEFMNFIMK